jgi:alanine racemase
MNFLIPHLTISLTAICGNWRMLGKIANGAECSAVVKANAYGCGMDKVAPALFNAGCKTFFVATLSEAVALRALLQEAMIYVLSGLRLEESSDYQTHNLRPVLNSLEEVQEWLSAFGATPAPFALHFDTGMNRLGIKPAQFAQVPTCQPDLVMSHFASSDMQENQLNQVQINAFEILRAHYPTAKACIANSSAIFLPQRPFYDLVRPGYALYGGNPTPNAPNPMQSVVHLHAPILQVKNVSIGETAGYNATWAAKRDSRLIILPVGHADGYHCTASGNGNNAGGQIAWNNALFPIIGRISMDLMMADVTDAAILPHRGDVVELIGPHLPIDAVAARMKTIGYEVLTSLGQRYRRTYI